MEGLYIFNTQVVTHKKNQLIKITFCTSGPLRASLLFSYHLMKDSFRSWFDAHVCDWSWFWCWKLPQMMKTAERLRGSAPLQDCYSCFWHTQTQGCHFEGYLPALHSTQTNARRKKGTFFFFFYYYCSVADLYHSRYCSTLLFWFLMPCFQKLQQNNSTSKNGPYYLNAERKI